MRGPAGGMAVDAVIVGIVVAVILLATAHIWGRWLVIGARRAWRNVTIAGGAIWRFGRGLVGQGQTRPQGKDY